jgi:flagellar biosynthesis protein
MLNRSKPREAVALEYTEGESAPVVVAAGKGAVAENIIRRAQELNVPLYEDPELAHTLNMLGIGEQIPPELYTVVAQVLIFVCDVDKLTGEVNRAAPSPGTPR